MPTRLHLAALLATLTVADMAAAAPQVEVRARTVIQLNPIVRTRFGISLSGQVTDRATPDPIPHAAIIINIDGEIFSAFTDQRGRFETTIYTEEGEHDIRVSFPGDRYLDGSEQFLEDFNVANEPLELSLSADPVGDNYELVVRAQSAGRAAIVPVVLWGGDVTAVELDKLASLTTSGGGRAAKTLTRAELGGFGDKRIEARFVGDDTYDAATASVTFSINANTKTTFRLEDSRLAFEDTLRGSGKVSLEDGDALAKQRVILEAAGRELAEASTDKDGRFTLKVEASELGEGEIAVQAVLYADARWLTTSRSKPQTVTIAEKKPVPIAATLAAFGATCMALLAFVAFRTKPWTRWLERFSRREPEAPNVSSQKKGRRPPGLAPARPSLVSTLRRPSDFGFSGRVLDVVTGRPIASATILVETSRGTEQSDHRVSSDASGVFSIDELPAGGWRVVASARGYMPEAFDITVPHKGELRNANIDLLAVREYIFDLYGELARPLLPGTDRWGVWTPRQIFEHVRTQRRARALANLTDQVEELYFSQRTPEVDAVEMAKEQIAEAKRELRGSGSDAERP